ncbi:hypothetical protein MIR68_012604 [Amoeboaphelidium protococcarum]|nr:hypothetical protein MIR68_012604 [Amoeboaphelidium protococcarum]
MIQGQGLMQQLPDEILIKIFSCLKDGQKSFDMSSHNDLANLALCCKAFNGAANELMWTSPSLTRMSQLKALLQAVNSSRVTGANIPLKQLHIDYFLARHLRHQHISQIVRACGQSIKSIVLPTQSARRSSSLTSAELDNNAESELLNTDDQHDTADRVCQSRKLCTDTLIEIANTCPNLVSISIEDCVTNAVYGERGFEALLSNCRKLTKVSFINCVNLTESSLMKLQPLRGEQRHVIDTLFLDGCEQISNQWLHNLSALVFIRNKRVIRCQTVIDLIEPQSIARQLSHLQQTAIGISGIMQRLERVEVEGAASQTVLREITAQADDAVFASALFG